MYSKFVRKTISLKGIELKVKPKNPLKPKGKCTTHIPL
jgi:hypothetical protein